MKQVVFAGLATLGFLCLGPVPAKAQDAQALKAECLNRLADPQQYQAQDDTQAPVSFRKVRPGPIRAGHFVFATRLWRPYPRTLNCTHSSAPCI